jgi:hypothetical protein
MQDELNKIISQAMNNSSELEQDQPTPLDNRELSEEDLEAVAGGIICRPPLRTLPWPCRFNTIRTFWICPKY